MQRVIDISEEDYNRIVHIMDAVDPKIDNWQNRLGYARKDSVPLDEIRERRNK